MIQHIKKLFIGMIVISCFTCFQRADYNLPLFAFAFFLWDYKHPNVPLQVIQLQKIRLFYLFVFTWAADFIWLIYWGATWSSAQYQASGTAGASSLVLVLSIIEFILKVQKISIQLAIIIICYIFDPECNTTIKNLVPNIKSILNPSS